MRSKVAISERTFFFSIAFSVTTGSCGHYENGCAGSSVWIQLVLVIDRHHFIFLSHCTYAST